MISKFVGLISSIYFLSVGLPAISAVKPSISITRFYKASNNYEAFETKDYKAFKSNEAYVILVKEDSEEGRHNVFYWIGTQVPYIVGQNVGEYAIQLYFEHPSKAANLYHEVEGMETNTFKALFGEGVDNLDNSATNGQGTSETIHEKETRMILIEKLYRMREIEFSLENIKKQDICFVAFNSKTVFLYCGNGAVDELNMVHLAVYLTKIISTKMGSQVNILKQVGLQSDPEFLAEFKRASGLVEMWKESSDYKKNKEVVSLEDGFDTKFQLLITHFYSGRKTIAEIMIPKIYHLLDFDSELCYIFDSCLEDIGMFVWIGKNADLEINKCCAGNVHSEHIRPECSRKRPVTFIKEEDTRLPTLGKKQLRIDIKDFIDIMFRLKLSWTDVLKNEKASSSEIVS